MSYTLDEIAEILKETHKDLAGRFQEHRGKVDELSTLAKNEMDQSSLVASKMAAVESAYCALTGKEMGAVKERQAAVRDRESNVGEAPDPLARIAALERQLESCQRAFRDTTGIDPDPTY